MNAKHLSKFSISKKLALLGTIIAVAIIAAFSICATSQAQALMNKTSTVNATGDNWKLVVQDNIPEHNLRYSRGVISGYSAGDGDWENGHNVGEYLDYDVSNYNCCQITSSSSNRDSSYFYELNFNFYQKTQSNETIHIDFSVVFDSEQNNFAWYLGNKKVPLGESSNDSIEIDEAHFEEALNFSYSEGPLMSGANISGHVANANDAWQPVPGAFVQYCQWSPWFWDYVPVPEMSTFTDWFGNYTIEGVTEDMLPGVIRVYRFGYEVGESAPIWFVPEGLDTIYRFVEMSPSEPPVPPVPPTPPDPPVPPGPVPPVPPQPVPPTPVPPTPTPVDPGTNVPQTGDSTAIALAIAGMLALCGACGFAACAKRKKFNK